MRKARNTLPGSKGNTDMEPLLHGLQIEWQNPGALQSYPRRIRAHPRKQVQRLAESIAAFGLDQPLVTDIYGVLIKGHARREAAMLLDLPAVPVLVRRDLTPEQVRTLRIADNKCAADDWHWNALKTELAGLVSNDRGTTGFDPDELDALLHGDAPGITFPEFDERVCGDNIWTCPHCGGRLVR